MEIHVGTDFYTLQYVNRSFNFTFVHLLQALCIFEGYIFKFEYMQAQVSIGTWAKLLILQFVHLIGSVHFLGLYFQV